MEFALAFRRAGNDRPCGLPSCFDFRLTEIECFRPYWQGLVYTTLTAVSLAALQFC